MTEQTDGPAVGAGGRDIRIRALDGGLEAVAAMWDALYEHQRAHGLLAPIPDGAFAEWARSLATVLGRFGFVTVASVDGVDAGFCAGRMRPMPPYYGGGYTGYISEVFVDPAARGLGIGRTLVDAGVRWFRERDVRRVELQVVWRNEAALAFYRRLGWVEDVVQFVLLDEPAPPAGTPSS